MRSIFSGELSAFRYQKAFCSVFTFHMLLMHTKCEVCGKLLSDVIVGLLGSRASAC